MSAHADNGMNELDLHSALHVLVHPDMGLAVRIVKRPGAELIDIALIVPEYLLHSLRVPVTGGVNHRKRKKLGECGQFLDLMSKDVRRKK